MKFALMILVMVACNGFGTGTESGNYSLKIRCPPEETPNTGKACDLQSISFLLDNGQTYIQEGIEGYTEAICGVAEIPNIIQFPYYVKTTLKTTSGDTVNLKFEWKNIPKKGTCGTEGDVDCALKFDIPLTSEEANILKNGFSMLCLALPNIGIFGIDWQSCKWTGEETHYTPCNY